jgi:hypothetical protein
METDSSPAGRFLVLRAVALTAGAVMLALALATPASGAAAGHASASKIISARPTAEEFRSARFSHPLLISNRWTPLVPGREFVLNGVVREGRRRVLTHRISSIVTDMTKLIDGIPCVVVWERDFSEGKLQESELFFVAQDDRKNVWLFGEYPAVYKGGRFQGAPENFVAPTFGTQPGIFMYQSPRVGKDYSLAFAPHIRFYDRARVLRRGLKICTHARCFRNVVEVDEYAPFNPGDRHQRKFYAPGVGTYFLAKPAGEPNPETVSLAEAKHLDAAAMAAARAGVLETEGLAYRTSDAYRQTPPATAGQ